ncbi:MAG: hypothetical protein QOE60_2133, partial [Thermoleophilaceae bacterium]|nr:hypothetical protein [Thermoleophilaceae bacterium]
TTEGHGHAAAGGVGMPVFGLPQAVGSLRSALGDSGGDGGRLRR